MDFELDSFKDFVLHRNQLILKDEEVDAQLIYLSKNCIQQYQLLEREVEAQVKNTLNQARQIKNKCNNELLKLQNTLTDLITNFNVQSNAQILPVLEFIDDEELKAKLKKELCKNPTDRFEQIEMIEL